MVSDRIDPTAALENLLRVAKTGIIAPSDRAGLDATRASTKIGSGRAASIGIPRRCSPSRLQRRDPREEEQPRKSSRGSCIGTSRASAELAAERKRRIHRRVDLPTSRSASAISVAISSSNASRRRSWLDRMPLFDGHRDDPTRL